MKTSDRIQKKIVLRAPLARVWSAISDARQFGAWFGLEVDGPFVAGKPIKGVMRPTTVDPEVAKLQEPHTGKPFQILVETVEPMHQRFVEPSRELAGVRISTETVECFQKGVRIAVHRRSYQRDRATTLREHMPEKVVYSNVASRFTFGA